MTNTGIIWKDGDCWRDLTDDSEAAGTATVVSLAGATRYIDFEVGEQCRVASVRARPMPGDEEWLPFEAWRLTPCGLVTGHEGRRAHSMPLWLVLAGFVCECCWPGTKLGLQVVAAIEAGARPVARGHPIRLCGASWCQRRLAAAGNNLN